MFELLDIPASEVAAHPDALAETMRGKQLGLILRQAIPGDALAPVVARLERGECRLKRHEAEYFKGHSYGGIVVTSTSDLRDYLDEGVQFRDSCAELFVGAPDYQTRIEQLLGAMSGGRTLTVPRAADGRPYIASSIWGLVPGGKIDLHCENETVDFAGMHHLSTLIDRSDQLSFYLTLGVPESGGEIRISSLQYAEGAGRMLLSADRDTAQTLATVDSHASTVPQLKTGDLLIFDAGRHYHRVTPVAGSRIRWTMGGFLALACDHKSIHYWS